MISGRRSQLGKVRLLKPAWLCAILLIWGCAVLAEFDAANTAIASQIYINGPTYLDEKILTRNAAGQEAYYLLKDLYTVAAIVDEAGNILEAYTYTGYGLPTTVEMGGITCTRGDVNGDGSVDVADTAAFQAVISGADTDPVHICAADIDGDGDVDAIDEDLLLLCRFLGTCAGVCAGGDLNADGVVDLADQAVFLDVLLGYTGQTWELCAADLSRDGVINGADVKLFINCLTNVNIACPPPLGGGVQTITNPFLFTGQRLDILDGGNLLLYDYKARVQDPLHGRFHQRDPVEFADAYNLYEYAASRPTLLTDPTGEFAIGTFVDLLGSIAIRKAFFALEIGSTLAAAIDLSNALRSGIGLQEALLDVLIGAAANRLGAGLFDEILLSLQRAKRIIGKLVSGLRFSRSRGLPRLLPARGGLFVSEFSTNKGLLEFAAEIGQDTIAGGRLHLQDIAIFPKGVEKLAIGNAGVKMVERELIEWARGLGFTELRITARRFSGANKGKLVDLIIKL